MGLPARSLLAFSPGLVGCFVGGGSKSLEVAKGIPEPYCPFCSQAFEEGATLVYRGLPLPTPQQSAAGSRET